MGKYTNQQVDAESIIYHLRDIANELAEANRLKRVELTIAHVYKHLISDKDLEDQA